jgi:hypothetical protein
MDLNFIASFVEIEITFRSKNHLHFKYDDNYDNIRQQYGITGIQHQMTLFCAIIVAEEQKQTLRLSVHHVLKEQNAMKGINEVVFSSMVTVHFVPLIYQLGWLIIEVFLD